MLFCYVVHRFISKLFRWANNFHNHCHNNAIRLPTLLKLLDAFPNRLGVVDKLWIFRSSYWHWTNTRKCKIQLWSVDFKSIVCQSAKDWDICPGHVSFAQAISAFLYRFIYFNFYFSIVRLCNEAILFTSYYFNGICYTFPLFLFKFPSSPNYVKHYWFSYSCNCNVEKS